MTLFFRSRGRAALGIITLLSAILPAAAGMQDMLNAIQTSEFRFARTESEVPFLPLGWMENRYYPNATFKPEEGNPPETTVAENTLGIGGALPAWVANRDMLLLGGDISWDRINVKSGPYPDQSVLTITPVTAWLHQFGEDELVGTFAAPMFSCEFINSRQWGTSGYGGVVGMHYFSDKLQLLYGGVYQNSFGANMGYPYLGVNWLPDSRWSVAIVFPWPAVTYSPSDRWLLQLTMGPGGSSWVKQDGEFLTTQSLGSWNITAGSGYRFYHKFWLVGQVGMAGWRGVTIESDGNRERLESTPSLLFSLAIQFRP